VSRPGPSPRERLVRWLPVVGWMALIAVLSHQPGLRVSDDPGVDRPLRVAAHLVTFAVLGGLVALALRGPGGLSRDRAAVAVAVAALYGVIDEIHQSFVPDRTGQLSDIAIDAVGAVVGVAVVAALLRRLAATGSRERGAPNRSG
jgi:VanZ family protein